MAGTQKSNVSASKLANRRELAYFNKNEWYPTRVANFKKWTYTGLASNASMFDYLGKEPCSSKVQSPVETLGLPSSSPVLIKEEPADPTEPPGFKCSTSSHLAPALYPEKPTLDKNATPPTPRTMTKTGSQSQNPKPNPPKMTLKRKLPQITLPPLPTKNPPNDELWCQLCKVTCSSPFNMRQHLRGRPHKAKMQLTKKLKNIHTGGGSSIGNYTCDVCHIWCTDRNALGMHMNGKKHKVKVQGDVDKKRLVHCDTCGVQCMNVESFRQHLKGRQHAMKQGCNDASPSEATKDVVHFKPVKSSRVNNRKPRLGFAVEKTVSTRPQRSMARTGERRWADYVDWEEPLKGIFKRRATSSSATPL